MASILTLDSNAAKNPINVPVLSGELVINGTAELETFVVPVDANVKINSGGAVDIIKFIGGASEYSVHSDGNDVLFTNKSSGTVITVAKVGAVGDQVQFGTTGLPTALKIVDGAIVLGEDDTAQTITTEVLDVTGATGTTGPADEDAPVFISATVVDNTLIMSYADASALAAATKPDASAFVVQTNDTIKDVTAVTVDATARTVTLTLATAVVFGETVKVSYFDSTESNDAKAIQDASGNDAATLIQGAVVNATLEKDDVAPVFLSAVAADQTLTLNYNEALNATNSPTDKLFVVQVDGVTTSVTNVAVVDNTVVLTLASAVIPGAVVTVSYLDRNATDDTNAIQDASGNDAAWFIGKVAVTAPPNEAPVVDAGSFTVATDGTEVGAVTATDPEGTAVTYAITDGNDADGNGIDAFVIDTETGALTVNDPAELVAGETITLTIEATDEAGQVGTGTVTVAVTEPVEPPNEAPVVDAGSFTVATDSTEVGAVTATDPEGTAVTYAITDGNDADGNGVDAFVIDTETGALTVNDPAELVAGETITLTVEATDADGIVGTGTVTVEVTEPVEPPNQAPIVDAGSFTVATDGTEVGAVTATDPEGTAVTYAITDGNDADGNGVDAFVIDTETGALTVNDPAELVAGETITLTIEATDEAGQVGTGTVTVAVTEPVEPPNEAPVVDAGSFTVATDGTEVGAVTATDPEGTAVTYAITDGNDADGNGVDAFVIDTETGALTVNDPAELVAGETITLTIEATDEDGMVGTGTVTVEVTEPVEPPNQAPVVDAGSFTVATDGTEVGAVTATDPEGTAVTYAITDGNDADGNGVDAFVIDTETGALTVNDPAELVAGETITLTIEATDEAGQVGTGTVTVAVTEPVEPPNEAPVVDAGSFTVATDGTEVGAVTATDPEGTAVTYAITDGNDADGNGVDAFVIDTETGALTVNDPAELVAGETITLTLKRRMLTESLARYGDG
ncbi:cadherin domain-containing protein [Chromatium okenii]|uniref:Cadherin domain-containing protein n=1 Tax=Chromatium okenii TaxID=61644 RepID=A0A2S7XRV1_9GAMM|nr:cadherin domain-containing protein [Chromatium okenii]PQJ96131.1 hypothetical protein CXB77_10000 [Chromatium okenii]